MHPLGLPRRPHWRGRPVYRTAHGLDVQLQPPCNLLLRYALHQVQVADLGPLAHPDHLRVLLATSTRRPCLGPSISTRKLLLPSAQGSFFSLPFPKHVTLVQQPVEDRDGQHLGPVANALVGDAVGNAARRCYCATASSSDASVATTELRLWLLDRLHDLDGPRRGAGTA